VSLPGGLNDSVVPCPECKKYLRVRRDEVAGRLIGISAECIGPQPKAGGEVPPATRERPPRIRTTPLKIRDLARLHLPLSRRAFFLAWGIFAAPFAVPFALGLLSARREDLIHAIAFFLLVPPMLSALLCLFIIPFLAQPRQSSKVFAR